jgi:hypothetical protein
MSYVIAGLVALLLVIGAVDLWERHELTLNAERSAAAKAVNQVQIETAGENHDQELAALRAYRDAHPDVAPVRLCSPVVQAAPKAKAGSSSSPTVLQPMPGPDPGLRPEPGPDLRGMLEGLAAYADQVSADLREQQAVQ